jgi:hypothetical protein
MLFSNGLRKIRTIVRRRAFRVPRCALAAGLAATSLVINTPSTMSGLREGLQAPLEVIQGLWFNHNNSIEKPTKVKDSKLPCKRTGRWMFESICNSANKKGWTAASKEKSICCAHLKMVGTDKNNMKIVAVALDHTCTGEQCKNRMRNQKTEVLKAASVAVKHYHYVTSILRLLRGPMNAQGKAMRQYMCKACGGTTIRVANNSGP